MDPSTSGSLIVFAALDNAPTVWTPALRAMVDGPKMVKAVRSIAIAPDETKVATADEAGNIAVWNPHTSARMADDRRLPEPALDLAFAPNGDGLAIASGKSVYLWPFDGALTEVAEFPAKVEAISFHPSETILAVGAGDQIYALDAIPGPASPVFLGRHADRVLDLDFSTDGTQLASASADSTARVWQMPAGPEMPATEIQLLQLVGNVLDVDFEDVARTSNDGNSSLLTAASDDGTAQVWRLGVADSGPYPLRVKHTGPIYSTAFMGSSGTLATASGDGTLRIWNTRDGPQPPPAVISSEEAGPNGQVTTLTLSDSARYLLTTTAGGTGTIWNSDAGTMAGRVSLTAAITASVYSDRSSTAAVGSYGGDVAIVSASGPGPGITFDAPITSLALDRAGRLLAVGTGSGKVAVVEVQTMRSYPAPTLVGSISQVALSADGRYLVAASANRGGYLLDRIVGEETPIDARIQDFTFDPASEFLAIADSDRGLSVYRLANKEQLISSDYSYGLGVRTLAFSASGDKLAVGEGSVVHIVDVHGKPLITPSDAGDGLVSALKFALADAVVLVSRHHSPPELRDASTGSLIVQVPARSPLSRADISTSAEQIAVATGVGTAGLWPGPKRWWEAACQLAGRNMSMAEWQSIVGSGTGTHSSDKYVQHCAALPEGKGAPRRPVVAEAAPIVAGKYRVSAVPSVTPISGGERSIAIREHSAFYDCDAVYDRSLSTPPGFGSALERPERSAEPETLVGRYPLTGLPTGTNGTNHSAVVVKFGVPGTRGSDAPDSTELRQVGLTEADVVVEVQTEGSPRLVAAFHSELAAVAGPVGSARHSDPLVVAAFQNPLFSWNLSQPTVTSHVQAAAADGLLRSLSPIQVPQEYASDLLRPTRDNLFVSPRSLSQKFGSSGPPRELFNYSVDGVTQGYQIVGVGVDWLGGYHTDLIWDASAGGWQRLQAGALFTEAGGKLIAPTNIVLVGTRYRDSSSESTARQACSLGSGGAVVLSNGSRIDGYWRRDSPQAGWALRTAAGEDIRLRPGKTWVILLEGSVTDLTASEVSSILANARR